MKSSYARYANNEYQKAKHQDDGDDDEPNRQYCASAGSQTAWHNRVATHINAWWLRDHIPPTATSAGALSVARLMHNDSAIRATFAFSRENHVLPTNRACAASDFHKRPNDSAHRLGAQDFRN